MALTYDIAVEGLDNYLQEKTTHSTKAILHFMQLMCSGKWGHPDEQNDFANMCANFDRYVKGTGKTSIGRKQFEEWWEAQGTGIAGDWSDEALIELQEDELPDLDAALKKLEDYSKTVDNSPQAHRLKVENTELRNEVNRLKAELKAANDKLEAIRGIILWG